MEANQAIINRFKKLIRDITSGIDHGTVCPIIGGNFIDIYKHKMGIE